MNPKESPQSGPHASWNVRDLANLQLKYSESLGIHCASGFEAQADTSAAAIDQLITDIGGPEILRDHRIWQIIVGEEMDIRYGALYFSVHRTLAENTECLREMLGRPLSEAPSMTAEELFERPVRRLKNKVRMAIAATIAVCLGGAAGGVSWYLTRPDEITTACRIRFIPETDGYRPSCDITEREGLKPILQFQKRGPEGERLGLHEAYLSYSRKGKICISKRRLPVKPRTTTELPTETFMCAAPPPKLYHQAE